jgi:hypothetical protein
MFFMEAYGKVICNFGSKKYHIVFSYNFFPFLVIKTLDLEPNPDPDWYPIQPKMLDLDPEPMNPDPKHWYFGPGDSPLLPSRRPIKFSLCYGWIGSSHVPIPLYPPSR